MVVLWFNKFQKLVLGAKGKFMEKEKYLKAQMENGWECEQFAAKKKHLNTK